MVDRAARHLWSARGDRGGVTGHDGGAGVTSRLTGRQLLDGKGLSVGRVRDVAILPTAGGEPPWALGLVVTLQRRQIFVNLGRVAEISIDGAHLRGGTIDLRRFSRRTGEVLASELYGRPAGAGSVLDVGIAASGRRRGGWEVSALAIGQSQGLSLSLRHQSVTVVPWDTHPELFKACALAGQLINCVECIRPIWPAQSRQCRPPGGGSSPRRSRTGS